MRPNQHIYIIDDDKIVHMLLTKLIEKTNLKGCPSAFECPNEAMLHLRETYNTTDQFLIFLDINMPFISGWGFLNTIEKFALPANTAVFIVTSSVNKEDKERAASYQLVKRFVEKPVKVETLLEIEKEY